MPQPWHLGNDVVDRADSRYRGKAEDHRFLRRVFAREERIAIRDADDPDLALWLHWTAKEAAFKSATKIRGSPPVFHHPDFRVSGLQTTSPPGKAGRDPVLVGPGDPGAAPVSGQVDYGELTLALRIHVTSKAIHALTWAADSGDAPPFDGPRPLPSLRAGISDLPPPPLDRWRDAFDAHLTSREWQCVSHRGSAVTRISARMALADALRRNRHELEIGCGPGLPGRRVPSVLLDGEELPVDLTLSHHGRFQAWAFRVP